MAFVGPCGQLRCFRRGLGLREERAVAVNASFFVGNAADTAFDPLVGATGFELAGFF